VKRVIAWFAENGVAANLLMWLFVVGGVLAAATTIPMKTFPDVDVGMISVGVVYPGAAPEEVEEGICVRIEEEIDGVDGVDRITSSSAEGACGVTIEVMQGADEARVLDDVKNRIDAIDTFPEEAEKPVISQVVPRRSVIDVAVSGPLDERSLKELGQQIRDELSLLPDVTQVELRNARPYEVSIEVSESALRRHGIAFDDVVRSVRASSLDLPGGSIKTRGGEILLRSKGQAYRGAEFERLVLLARPDGTRLLLGDVARVVDGFQDTDQRAFFDGEPAVVIRVFRVGEQDTLAIARSVKDYVAKKQVALPEGTRLTIWQDSTVTLRDRLDVLLSNGQLGFALVFGLLALFLQLRLAAWVACGVPVAMMGALFSFPFFGIAIDMISLFAFILVLGILVDDAIVVGESIYTEQERTGERLASAVSGTLEVAIPVIFGVMTTIATFMPLMMVPGPMGQVFGGIAAVVILCLGFSLVESQLILPAHLGHGRERRRERAPGRWARLQRASATGLERFRDRHYGPWLERAIEWRYTTLAAAAGALLLTVGAVASNRLPFSFFPAIEADFVAARLTMPTGVPVESTERGVRQILEALERLRAELDGERESGVRSQVQHVYAAVGEQPMASRGGGPMGPVQSISGAHYGEVTAELIPAEQRELSTKQIADRWRELTGPVADAVELTFAMELFSAGNDIDLQLQGPSVDDLREAATRLRAELETFPGVVDVTDSFRSGKEEIQLRVLPAAEALGVALRDLARQVRQAFYGEEAQRVQRGRDDVRVMVRYTEDERRSLGALEDMRVRTAQGSEVPFALVAEVEEGRGYSTIKRADRQRVVNVTAAVDRSHTTADRVLAALRAGALPAILADYPGMSYSLQGQQREQARALGGLIRWFGIALFGVYALLAIPLRSYTQPFIVMSVIPFGLVGAVLGHLLVGVPNLSFMSVMGFVALSGVVVNASLVLVHAVNRLRAEGASTAEAARDGAITRFRAIFLTTVTTFAGLAPLIAARSMQAQFLIPMAVSLAFGVLVASGITLFVVPSLYVILEDLRRAPARLRAHAGRARAAMPAGASSGAAPAKSPLDRAPDL
jgi:multidrug efflux pump subunit AcrB